MTGPGHLACFAYHRSVAPMLWMLVAIAVGEVGVVHLLVALLAGPAAAAALSLLTLAGIAWLVRVVRSLQRLPVVIGPRRVMLRAGPLKCVTVARDNIRAIEGEISAAEAKRREVLKLSLLAHPNVVVRLFEPIRLGRRTVRAIAHRLDDPAAFRAALA